MKRMLCALLAVMTLLTALPLSALAATTMYVNTANGKTLNFRSNTDSAPDAIIGQIPFGAAVKVIDLLESDYWAEITYNGRHGYVVTRHLSRTKPTKKPTSKTTKKAVSKGLYDGFVSDVYEASVKPATPAGVANMRWAPDKSAPICAVYHANAKLTVLATNGEWAQVLDSEKNLCGFMSVKFLR